MENTDASLPAKVVFLGVAWCAFHILMLIYVLLRKANVLTIVW